ncbi:MAG: isoprenyl transferase [Anaerorhabdus sp.]
MNEIKHVAIIMDGNGRWANEKNKERTHGHLKGADNVREIAIAADKEKISVLTLFAFSTENWKRPSKEIEYLMKLPFIFFKKFLNELMEKDIKVEMIGFTDQIPKETMDLFNKVIEKTKNNKGMILCFAMNYGSRLEIMDAAKRFASDVKKNKASINISEKEFSNYLMTSSYPDVDCLIRTSGEYRISNFLLWQIAYSELIFVKKSWPEFNSQDFVDCCNEFKNRKRRFGGV